jgi:hypothetical protein
VRYFGRIQRIVTRFGRKGPGALNFRHKNVGAWLSLVERPVRDRKVAGSNPVAPTNFTKVPHPSPAAPKRNIHPNQSRPEERSIQQVRGFARGAALSLSIAADGRPFARLLDDIAFRHWGVVDVRSLPWQFEPYKAVAALGEISPMANCCTTRGHYSGSSTTRHRDLRASHVVTLDASIERLCPHPTLFQRTTLSRLRTKRQAGMHDATEHHGSTSATGSLRYGAAPFLLLETAGGRVGRSDRLPAVRLTNVS